MKWIERQVPVTGQPLPGLHALVNQTLLKRGLDEPEAARGFLDPDVYQPSPAQELPGMTSAVARVADAIRSGDPICVWGDFDVDGQTSTTVLVQGLKSMGADVTYHIPVRKNESHGVNIENLAWIIDGGAKLILTCDTGISANEAVKYTNLRGVDMVITDHHDLPDDLPAAAAVINPKMLAQRHPLASLAGVGVAYKLVEGLVSTLQPAEFEIAGLLDLVALGLVADLAILRGDARYLVQKGLAELRQTRRIGLKTMMELASLSAGNLTEEHIGFTIGPRLNALGRLGDANPVVEFLTTTDKPRARVLATLLEGLNAERKLLCDQVYQAVEAKFRDDPKLLTHAAIVLDHPDWPGGVVGIVASKIVERYHKPAILLTAPKGQAARGSARSIEGLNITAAIAEQKDILIGYGGHPMAAGLSLEPDKLPEFRHRLSRTIERMLGESSTDEGELTIDGWVGLDDANLDLAGQLESLAPFGPGNEKLVLAIPGLVINSSNKLGKNNEHLKMTVVDESGSSQQVLWWDGGDQDLPAGKFDLAFTIRASDWRGLRQVQLEFVDFRVLETETVVIKRDKVELLDYRVADFPDKILQIEKNMPGAICWAEGEEKQRAGGKDRNGLSEADTLIVWTSPPSHREFKAVMDVVKPRKVIVFAIDPGSDRPGSFLERLAGLVKTTINKNNGKTSYSALAAATAQTVAAARSGLKYLSKTGSVTVEALPNDEVNLTIGGIIDEGEAKKALYELNSNLLESGAYREHFKNQTSLNLE